MKKINYPFVLLLFLSFCTSCIREDNTPVKIEPITGAVVDPEMGGPTEKNQVWIELSTGNGKTTLRENWDLGFYSGAEFRVILNGSLVMAVGKIENSYNIDALNSASVKNLKPLVQVANFTDNSKYIDDPSGDILNQTTGIQEIKANEDENNVYLLNMGYTAYSGATVPGSVYTLGNERGWKKIKIIRFHEGYKIQYANLDETSHKEYVITKDADFNYKFFSFFTETEAEIQPKKKNWDLCFTVFTNLVNNPENNLPTSYIFPDVVLHNILGNVGAYEVTTANGQGETEYNRFTKENIDPSKFVFNDQRTIGGNWRTTTGANGAEVYSNKFYIVKNSDGFYFKLRFLRMKNQDGYRGYPQFEYKAL
ncbi:HmuY family protein [Kaistella sp.]|uniref:HmuY family protein n=1 Tax=Kaistella sp. TaxID=2782235 RepID=UPI003C59C5EC